MTENQMLLLRDSLVIALERIQTDHKAIVGLTADFVALRDTIKDIDPGHFPRSYRKKRHLLETVNVSVQTMRETLDSGDALTPLIQKLKDWKGQ
jgi:hypothetical protein